MYHLAVLLSAFSLALAARMQDLTRTREEGKEILTCDMIFCGLGRECVDEFGEPYCDCVEQCKEPPSPVCGSDGVTYNSSCELHKEACRTNKQIEVVSNMTCTVEEEAVQEALDALKTKNMPNPVVCLEKDRDQIRSSLVDWLMKQELDIAFEALSYKSILKQYFDILDEDKDGALDTMEFMKLLEKNESISDVLSADYNSNPVLRGLCLDALVDITDENSNYKLEFSEFHKCLDPDFTPPKVRCELEGVRFNDGQVVPVACNSCKCACGKWVCTTLKCDEEKNGVDKKD